MTLKLRQRFITLTSLIASLCRLEGKIDYTNAQIQGISKTVGLLSEDLQRIQKGLVRRDGNVDFTDEPGPAIPPSVSRPIEDVFEDLRQKAPAAFEKWRPLLDVNAETFTGFPTHSCAVSGHPVGHFFKYYCRPQLRGAVLDIGCGPQPVPSYLDGYPLDLIRGIDPISEPDDHPFEFERALAESLPWPDESFDIAVSGTSLDHVLLLDESYSEIRRVLKAGGKFLVWVAFVEFAEDYDPYVTSIEPVDDFHMFHFTRESFERSVSEYFVIEDAVRIENEINHFFYTLFKA